MQGAPNSTSTSRAFIGRYCMHTIPFAIATQSRPHLPQTARDPQLVLLHNTIATYIHCHKLNLDAIKDEGSSLGTRAWALPEEVFLRLKTCFERGRGVVNFARELRRMVCSCGAAFCNAVRGWWRLEFAMALRAHGRIMRVSVSSRCRVCGLSFDLDVWKD